MLPAICADAANTCLLSGMMDPKVLQQSQMQHFTALNYMIAGSSIPAERGCGLGDVILLVGLNGESLSKIYRIAVFLLGMLFSQNVGARKLNPLNLDT